MRLRITTIRLSPAVLDALDVLARREGRDRSDLIRRFVLRPSPGLPALLRGIAGDESAQAGLRVRAGIIADILEAEMDPPSPSV